jgi:hypothetical protein
MNDKHYIEQIYVYSELSPDEKRLVDDHVRHCESCRRYLNEFMASQSLLRRAADHKIEPDHAAKLTGSVMAAIHAEVRPGFRFRWLDSAAVRYGMMTCSLALVVLFVMQDPFVNDRANRGKLMMHMPRWKPEVLNTASMMREVRNNFLSKDEPRSLYACIKEGACSEHAIQKIKSSHSAYAK